MAALPGEGKSKIVNLANSLCKDGVLPLIYFKLVYVINIQLCYLKSLLLSNDPEVRKSESTEC